MGRTPGRGWGAPRTLAHLAAHKVKMSVCGSAEHVFHKMSPFWRSSLSVLQRTRENAGGSAEFPKDRGNQNQVLERAKARNVLWNRKKETNAVYV